MTYADKVIAKYLQDLPEKDFIESCFSIIDKKRREVPFIFNKTQNELYEQMENWNVVLKYRKPGISVMVQSLMLARCIRRRNRNAVVLSFDKESTQRMLERTDWTMKHLPFEMKLEKESKNEFKIGTSNSKLFIGTAGSKAFGRGDDITDLHISELAWWEDTSILTGVLEALTDDARVFVESTANGPLNKFAKLYQKGKLKNSDWKSHFFPWWIDPELEKDVPANFHHTQEEKQLKALYNLTDRKLYWRRSKMINMLEPELFPQEFPANDEEAFIVLGNCIFDKLALANYTRLTREPTTVGELLVTQ